MLKSLHLTNAYHPTSGGVRTVYRALLASANRRGRLVRLVVPAEQDSVEDVGEFGRIYYVRAPRAFAIDGRYRIIMPQRYLLPDPHGIAAILTAEQPDIVEICDKLSLFYVAGLLRKGWIAGGQRPVLVGISAERFDDNVGTFVSKGATGQHLARWYMRNLYTPMFDYHVANSEYTAAELRTALPPHRQQAVHICPPGVEPQLLTLDRATPRAKAEFLDKVGGNDRTVVLLYAGRLSPEKNVDLLVEMLARLVAAERPDGRNYRLVFAGDGPRLDALRDAAKRDVPGRATFLGNVGDRATFHQLLQVADVVVHPNPKEPFGIAPLEAMAAGVPVVLPDAGGVLSYATHDTAWLVPPDADAFAAAVRDLVHFPRAAATKATLARIRAAEFTFPNVIDRMFLLYDQFHRERMNALTTA